MLSELKYLTHLIRQTEKGQVTVMPQMAYKQYGYWHVDCPHCKFEGSIRTDGFTEGKCKNCSSIYNMLCCVTLEHVIQAKQPRYIFFLKTISIEPAPMPRRSVIMERRKDHVCFEKF